MVNKSTTEKSILGELLADWVDFVRALLWEKPWRLFLLLFALFAGYGGKLVTLSYNNDNVMRMMHSQPFGSFRHHRYGSSIYALLGLSDREIFFWSTWIGIGILVAAGLLLAYYFYEISCRRLRLDALFVLLLCFTLYPLHMEMLVYPTTAISQAINFALVTVSLLLIRRMENGNGWSSHFLPVFLLMVVFSCYESFTLVYSVVVLAALFLRTCLGDTIDLKILWKTLWRHGFYLMGALLLWGILIWISQSLNCYELAPGVGRDILWLSDPKTLHWAAANLLPDIFGYYVFNSMFYFALLEFWLAVAVACYFIWRKRDQFWILSGILILMLIAIFSLSLLQCFAHKYRTCQTFPVFVGFFLMLFYQWHGSGSKVVKIALFFIILFQTKELALMTKFERESSEHASYCFKTLGFDIKRQVPDYNEKKVIIAGSCREWQQLSGEDTLQLPFLYKFQHLGYYQNIGNNRFYLDSREEPRKLLEYHTGIIAESLSEEDLKTWRERVLADGQPAWPSSGYIREIDGNILVNMGYEEPVVQPSFLSRMIAFAKQILGRE